MTQDLEGPLRLTVAGASGPPEINTAALVVICLLLLVLLAVTFWWGRGSSAPRRNRIKLLGTRMLGGKRCVTLVEVEGERLLLGLGGDQVSLLRSFGRVAEKQGNGQGQEESGGIPAAAESAAAGGHRHERASVTRQPLSLRVKAGRSRGGQK